jgi:hypothetical protein
MLYQEMDFKTREEFTMALCGKDMRKYYFKAKSHTKDIQGILI